MAVLQRIQAASVAATPTSYVIDIRPPEERASGIGFLPGSIGLLPGESPEECLPPDDGLPVVLYCTSGRRSLQAAETLSSGWSGPVFSLDGGVLGWQEEGLPTCGVSGVEDIPRLTALERFPRLLLSCFAAETVENSLDGNAHASTLDPTTIVSAALAEPRVVPNSVLAMLRALDRVAEVARRSNFSLQKIAENTDRLRAALLSYQQR